MECKNIETGSDYINQEVKNWLNSGNAFCHSIQNLLSPHLLPKNLKIKICGTMICMFCFIWLWNSVSHIIGRT